MERSAEQRSGLARRRPVRGRDEWGIEFSRIVAFSDGVFAIAITLLALSIDIPQHLPSDTSVGEMLENQTGDLIAYAISFAVVGKLWLSHHWFFATVERFDNVLMGLNILYLAWIALIPVTSEVLGDYGDNSAGVIIYAIVMVAVSLTFQAQIGYSLRNDLLRPELRELEHRVVEPANLIVAAVFLLSIPVAFVSPLAAVLMWPIIFLTGRRLAFRIADLRS
ncbi:MAG TPA: TMEM175 family protein [Solirubrobacterales bacterium]|nr:TMEM175 family protein [Solirubrobacterales bacterium]